MEVFSSLIVLLLFVADVSKSPPSTVMPHIVVQSLLKGAFGFGEVFVVDVLMAAEGVSIRILRVELNGPGEEFESLFVLLLKGEAVSNSDPRFRRIYRFFKGLMGQEAEIDLLFEMPQAT